MNMQKIECIHEIRNRTMLGLAESKEIADFVIRHAGIEKLNALLNPPAQKLEYILPELSSVGTIQEGLNTVQKHQILELIHDYTMGIMGLPHALYQNVRDNLKEGKTGFQRG
jgi:hypothetical protein